ncbi:MAG: hypothetical protein ACOYKE_02415 [Ferruginibacter sp.]
MAFEVVTYNDGSGAGTGYVGSSNYLAFNVSQRGATNKSLPANILITHILVKSVNGATNSLGSAASQESIFPETVFEPGEITPLPVSVFLPEAINLYVGGINVTSRLSFLIIYTNIAL